MISFTVDGVPATQGSKTAIVRGTRAVLVEGKGAGRQRHADWRARVAYAAQQARGDTPLVDGPVSVWLTFALPRPASAPKRRRTWPISARSGDVDKLARSVLDSLTGVLFHDDAQVVYLAVSKDYADTPGVRVYVADGSNLAVDAETLRRRAASPT